MKNPATAAARGRLQRQTRRITRNDRRVVITMVPETDTP